MKTILALFCSVALLTIGRAEDVAALIAKGDALDAKLQNKQALEVYQSAEKLEPKNLVLICDISRQYGLMMDDVTAKEDKQALAEKALAYANRALALDPNSALSQLSVAVCYGRLAPLLDTKTKIAYSKQVKEHAERSLALDPNNDLTYYVLGAWNYEVASLGALTRTLVKLIYGEMPAATHEKAAEYLEKAVKMNPKRLGNHIELGRIYLALGRKEEARKEFNVGLQMPSREKDDPIAKERARQALKGL